MNNKRNINFVRYFASRFHKLKYHNLNILNQSLVRKPLNYDDIFFSEISVAINLNLITDDGSIASHFQCSGISFAVTSDGYRARVINNL